MKLYDRQGGGYYICNNLRIVLLVNIFMIILVILVPPISLFSIIKVAVLVAVILELILLIDCFKQGYRINSEGIQYYKWFRMKKILFTNVGSIIISHGMALHKGGYLGRWKIIERKIRFFPFPWFTICDSVPDKIINSQKQELNGRNIDYLLMDKGFIYSFSWNPSIIKYILNNYKGYYYITNSLSTRYKAKIEEFVEQDNSLKNRIHIIDDIVPNNFIFEDEMN